MHGHYHLGQTVSRGGVPKTWSLGGGGRSKILKEKGLGKGVNKGISHKDLVRS